MKNLINFDIKSYGWHTSWIELVGKQRFNRKKTYTESREHWRKGFLGLSSSSACDSITRTCSSTTKLDEQKSQSQWTFLFISSNLPRGIKKTNSENLHFEAILTTTTAGFVELSVTTQKTLSTQIRR